MKHNINIEYWKQSTGLTGQCLTERTQDLFSNTAALYHMVSGQRLSKMKMYRMAREGAREVKHDTGGRMMDTASAIMGIQLVELRKHLRKIKNRKKFRPEVVFSTMEVSNLRDLAKGKPGKQKSA